ncbi:MAG: cellulose biosynthesis protein BcsR [Aeromonas sp.]
MKESPLSPFGVTVEGDHITDIAIVQESFGVSLHYHDVAQEERLDALRRRYPLLGELDMRKKR